jgi:hypothetical protein
VAPRQAPAPEVLALAPSLKCRGAHDEVLPGRVLPADKRWNHTLGLRATQSLLHQTLRLPIYASRDASNDDYFISPELRYSFTDRIWGALGANVFGGKPRGPFGQLARDDNLYLQLRYEF